MLNLSTRLRIALNNINLNAVYLVMALLLIGSCSSEDASQRTNLKVPKSLIASSGARNVVLDWSGVANASSYTLYWSNNPNVNRNNSATIQTTSPHYEHVDLNNGSNYYYVVSSQTGSGESSLSNEVRGQPQIAAPAKPSILRLKSEDRRIQIDFDIIPGATEYEILWANSAESLNSTSATINQIKNITAPFVHTNLINGKEYFYQLRVSNSNSESTDSDIYQASPQLALPLTPVINNAVANSGEVTISWENFSNAESFTLFWSTTPNVGIDDAFLLQVNSPYIHAPLSLVVGQNYYYRIQARNRSGASALSNELHVTTPDVTSIAAAGTAPSAPAILDANNRLTVKPQIGDSQISLDWNPADGAVSLAYKLYWLRGNDILDTAVILDSNNNSGIIRNIQPPYTHINLQNGTYYYYRISAINNAGESALTPQSAIISARPEVIIAGVPSGVIALAADQSLTVHWNPVKRAVSYNLFISSTGGNVEMPNVSAPYVINNLSNGEPYAISLQSVSATKMSAVSTEVIATPQVAAPNAPTELVAIPNDASIQLQWRSASTVAAINPAEVAVSAYRIYWSYTSDVDINSGTLLDVTPQLVTTDKWQADVTGIDNGRRHYFVVSAVNSGGEGPASITAWALPQLPIPSAPSQVYAVAGNNFVNIHFQPAADTVNTVSYNLYWSKDQNSQRSATQVISNIPQSPTYVFTDGDSNGTTYYFQVSAASSGGESVYSPEFSATPQIPAPVSIPSNFGIAASSRQVKLNWDAISDASTYVIYWSTGANIDPETSAVLFTPDTNTSFVHSELQNGQTYYYKIAAKNIGGVGPLSPLIIASPQIDPPLTPTPFGAVANNAAVTLNWATVDNASSYLLQWRRLNDVVWTYIPGVQSSHRHVDLINGQTYEYQLIAQNAGGNSVPSTRIQVTPQQPIIATPQGLSVAAGNFSNAINWFTQADLTYTLYWSIANADPIASGQIINNALPTYVHINLSNGTNYNYQLIATYTDKSGNTFSSPASIISRATPSATPADAPKGLRAQAGDRTINVNWIAPANVAADTFYTLYWGTQANALPTNPISNVQAPLVHSGLNNGQDYNYRVTSTTAGNEGSSSNLATATPSPLTPTTPTAVSVISSNNQNNISWLSVTSASNYQVEWSLNGSFTDIQSSNITAPVTQFSHKGLSNGQTVFYRVLARNSNGGQSGYSHIVSGTPSSNSPTSNTIPVARGVNITDNNGGSILVNVELTANYSFFDADGDDEGSTLFQWYRNTNIIANATNRTYTTQLADSGQVLRLDVTPVAITGASPGATSISLDVIVGNSPPTIIAATLSDTNGGQLVVGDFIGTSYSFTDLDGDKPATPILQWFADDSVIAGATTGSFKVTPSQSGKIIRYEVTPVAQTGVLTGTPFPSTNSLTVINSVPIASNARITNGNAVNVGDQLQGAYDFFDIDKDLQGTSLLQWNRDGAPIGGATGSSYTAQIIDVGKAITFEVTPIASAGANPGLIDESLPTTVSAKPVVSQNLIGISSGMLVSLNSTTGKLTPTSGMGLAGFNAVKEIAYDYNDKLLYGVNILPKTSVSSTSQYTQIVTIDPISSDKQVHGYGGPIFVATTGIAIDPVTKILYSINADGEFYAYDMQAKTTTTIANIGLIGVTGLAFDKLGTGLLYTIQSSTQQLISITTSGVATVVNTLSSTLKNPTPNFSTPLSISFDPVTNKIIASVSTNPTATDYRELMAIDALTAVADEIGGFQVRAFRADVSLAFAYDPQTVSNSSLYFVPRLAAVSGVLRKINLPAYGGQKITRIPIPFRNLRAIAVVRNTGTIFGIDRDSKYVLRYSANTLTIAGQVNIPGLITSIALDPAKPNTMYAANRTELYSVDMTTWQITRLGAFGVSIEDMAFNPATGTLYGIDNALSNSGFYSINISNGAASLLFNVSGTNSNRLLTGIGFAEITPNTYQLHGLSNGRRLYSINLATGAASHIATTKSFAINLYNITFDGKFFIAAFNDTIKSVDITNLAGPSYVEVNRVEHTYPGFITAMTITDSTLYVATSQAFDFLYRVDPTSGFATKLGRMFVTINSISMSPTNQLYGVAGTALYLIDISGAAPVLTFVANIANASAISGIAFDSAGTLYGLRRTGTPAADLVSIDLATATVQTSVPIPYGTNGTLSYNANNDEFFIAATGVPYTVGSIAKNGVTNRIGAARFNKVAYRSIDDTLYRFADSTTANINTAKPDLSTTPIMSIGKFFAKAIAHDDISNTLYMINHDTGNLLKINKNTGIPVVIGFTELTDVSGLVFDPLRPAAEQLIAFDVSAGALATINPTTGQAKVRAGPYLNLFDLAIDTGISSTIYANNGINGLVTVDMATNTLSAPITFTNALDGSTFFNVKGISIDNNGNMFGVAQLDGSDFYILDIVKETAVVSHTLKKTGYETRYVLSMDKNTNTIYAFDQSTGNALSIDPLTGAGTTRGALHRYINRLVYNPSNSTLYATQSSSNRYLYSIDITDGSTTFIDGLRSNSIPANNGLALDPNTQTFYSTDSSFPPFLSHFDFSSSLSQTPFNFVGGNFSVTDLEWNLNNNALYGLSRSTNRLFQFTDLTTATGTFVGASIGTASYNSLVYSQANDVFFTIENETSLLQIDATTGVAAAQSIPLTGVLGTLQAMTYLP